MLMVGMAGVTTSMEVHLHLLDRKLSVEGSSFLR
jgi:hypothetical protein